MVTLVIWEEIFQPLRNLPPLVGRRNMIVQKRSHGGHGFLRRDMVLKKARNERGQLLRKHLEVQVAKQGGQRFQIPGRVRGRAGEGGRSRAIAGDLHLARVGDQDRARRDVAVDATRALKSMEELRRRERVVRHDQAKLGREQLGVFLGAPADRRQRLARDVFHDETTVALDFRRCNDHRQIDGMHSRKPLGFGFQRAKIDNAAVLRGHGLDHPRLLRAA